jgi:protein-disulfide isomerase
MILEVYSDFQCPACKNFHETILPGLIRDYVQSGKAYLVHREFPLPMHAHAREAARLATAAAKIGKYSVVCNSLFAKQNEWAANGKVLDAACAPLDAESAKKLRAMAKDPAIEAEVKRDQDRGVALGVNRTPLLVVKKDSRQFPPVDANTNYNLLKHLLDVYLAK